MSSRYTAPRDRSPPRHFDRRPSASAAYNPAPSSYRGSNDPPPSTLDRPPPRGPKADFRGGTYQFSPAPRGRGSFPSRTADTWDRDRERDRDTRNPAPPYRRDDDRGEWPRRERDFAPPDRGISFTRERAYVGRDRSASPDRPRRNSKEGLPSTYGRPIEPTSSYYGPPSRGGAVRGRGRGDYERGRGRPSFVSERDREFAPRSRSREEWRDREFDRGRAAGPDGERSDRFERRVYDRVDDRDGRSREHDVWPRDRSPGRNSTGRPASPGALSSVSQHGERYKADYDGGRKPSLAGPLTARSEGRREPDSDYFSTRNDPPRRDGPLSQQFPTPSVPQSSAIGLDYGPPPSAPMTTPAAPEKPVAQRVQPAKVDPSPVAPPLQPPSGPKADRVGPPPNTPSTPRVTGQQFESWTKTDSASRPPRPGPTVNTTPTPTDSNWKPADMLADNRAPATSVPDRPLPANVPSGPRATTGNFRGRLLSNEQVAPNAPPSAPRQPKANTLENRVVPNAPTGPRSSTFPVPGPPHNVPPTGPQAGANRQWVAPDYRPKPSIMNQMNKPYQPDVRERSSISGPSVRPGGVTYSSQQAKPKITQPMTTESASQMLSAKAVGLLSDIPSGAQTPADEDMVDSPADVEMSLPPSDEEDVEDDDGLDEDYFEASEQTHLKEMKLLESKKPPPPHLDPVTVALIVRIQLLGMIAQDIVPEAYESIKTFVDEPMDLDTAPVDGPISPKHTPEDRSGPTLEHPKPRGRPLSQPVINPIPTPPIDDLPYLNDAMDDCHVFEDMETTAEHTANTSLLLEDFEHNAWQQLDVLDDLRGFYKSRYPIWRRDVESAEQRLREVHQPSPAPASPAPSATPSLPAGPDRGGIERTRGARNTTDLDMQQAILMSQQSAREEEERREREAASNALPNYETEAVVPMMIKPSEVDLYYFEDTNKMVDQDFALDVYGFIPPEDDFTSEEQAAFIASYCQNPKKWGKIADAVPGRSYQDCITHYYLTKDKANYKDHWRRSQPKRGRRRAAVVKPRANNLMSDLALNEDGEGTPVAVTDSGRPRRAAAPTFGEGPDQEAATAAPQAKKPKEGAKDSDPAQPKARGRKGTATGKGRKTKDKALADPINQVLMPAGSGLESYPPKLERSITGKEKSGRSTLKPDGTNPKHEPFNGPMLAAQVPVDVKQIVPGDPPPTSTGPVSVPVTSYWSVPEQQKFPFLVQYFGRDFGLIASFLKTKSSIMIKNYYMRELSNGKQELEHYANIADEKRARGEPMGPPPTPVQPPKRRYEATPSMAVGPRTTTNIGDHSMSEVDPIPPVPKAIIEEFPSNSIQRVAGEVVAKPRTPREIAHHSPGNPNVHPKIEERTDRPLLHQKSLQGPPRGIFQDDPNPYISQHQKVQVSMQDASPRQRPSQVIEDRSIDIRPQQMQQHLELRGTDFGRTYQSHSREQVLQSHQPPSLSQYQPISDRPLTHASRAAGHSRHSSLANNLTSHEQAAADLASLRKPDHSRTMAYTTSAAHSPTAAPVQAAVAPNVESHPHIRQPQPRLEPPKPVPAKRSGIFSILNDEPPEPPVKRQSLESVKRVNVETPPPQPLPSQPSMLQSRHQDEVPRPSQSSYNLASRIEPMRKETRQEYNSSPAPASNGGSWIDRYDPRPQIPSNDQRNAPQSPAPYSVVPPVSQSTPVSMPGRYDVSSRNFDHFERNSESTNHRRSLLGMGHTQNHAPSPPPQQQQQQQQAMLLHRSSSGSSHHGRGPSSSYQQSTSSGPPAYSHSTSSASMSAMQHHRNQQSMDNPQRRATIQQHLREQEQAQTVHQRRDIDIMQQQPTQSTSRMSDHRDMYGSATDPRTAQHHVPPPQPSHTPQPQQMNMGYPNAPPVTRTFTPPIQSYNSNMGQGGHSHSHHSHHQQYPPHQPQYSQHSNSQGPSQHHPLYQNHPGYGQPQQTLQQQHQRNDHQRSVHQLGSAHQQQQQQQQQQGHYRGYSTDERR